MIKILLLHTDKKSVSSIQDFCAQVDTLNVNIQVSTDAFKAMQLLAKEHFDIVAVDIDDVSISDALYYYEVWGVKMPLLLVADDVDKMYTSQDLPKNTYAVDKDVGKVIETVLLITELPLLTASVDIVTVVLDDILAHKIFN